MTTAAFDLTQGNILDLAQSANHDGDCLCWRCLHWWATMSKPSYRESLSPFPESAVERYQGEGFAVRIYDDHFTALATVQNGYVSSDAPTIRSALLEMGCTRFSSLETYAAAHGWQIDHPYTKVQKRYGEDNLD